MDALDGADALAIMTEWNDFQQPDFEEMCQRMKSPGHLRRPQPLRARTMERLGFTYHSIGRPAVGIRQGDRETRRHGDSLRRISCLRLCLSPRLHLFS